MFGLKLGARVWTHDKPTGQIRSLKSEHDSASGFVNDRRAQPFDKMVLPLNTDDLTCKLNIDWLISSASIRELANTKRPLPIMLAIRLPVDDWIVSACWLSAKTIRDVMHDYQTAECKGLPSSFLAIKSGNTVMSVFTSWISPSIPRLGGSFQSFGLAGCFE